MIDETPGAGTGRSSLILTACTFAANLLEKPRWVEPLSRPVLVTITILRLKKHEKSFEAH